MDQIILNKLEEINNNLFLQKAVLSFDEACKYCSISKSKMYKHTSSSNIAFYKPEGKLIFFKREELDQWLLRNRQSSMDELQREATKYSLTKRR
ncbi:DNA binding domain-containing protein, excisionase family [Lutibacter agarilyticus]|uniref:DNA binding domain-containing protein, excisionase family n=1 Tax=Lutibacter agarilyticus TaxID=1109740 RepID=A0A238VYL4_9FLAO|nr:helix-turn-helix domain-containing protein [Lutibacter agarilyticus]SNR39261.1 DNA binding domain-containing protein, excisionase family [Lutibacter agarilyticus]